MLEISDPLADDQQDEGTKHFCRRDRDACVYRISSSVLERSVGDGMDML